jgi:cytochrome c6
MRRVALAAALVALAGNALATDPAQIYSLKCRGCHAKDGKGSAYGKTLGVPDLSATPATEAEVAQVVTAGKGRMTGYRERLTSEEIEALAKYVKSGLR